MGISPRIRWGSNFPGREWGTCLLISIPFLRKRPRLTYKVRSRVTVICKFFIASLFQTWLLTDETINQQFYKLIIIKLRGREGKGRLFEIKSGGRGGQFFKFFQVTQGFYEALPGDTKNGSVKNKAVQGSNENRRYIIYIFLNYSVKNRETGIGKKHLKTSIKLLLSYFITSLFLCKWTF